MGERRDDTPQHQTNSATWCYDFTKSNRYLPVVAFYVYMLLCSDDSIYTGHSDDLEVRLAKHRNRTYCGYTAKRLPVRLIFSDSFATREEALPAERQIKRWTRRKKLALAAGDMTLLQRLALRRRRQPAGYIPRAMSRNPSLSP